MNRIQPQGIVPHHLLLALQRHVGSQLFLSHAPVAWRKQPSYQIPACLGMSSCLIRYAIVFIEVSGVETKFEGDRRRRKGWGSRITNPHFWGLEVGVTPTSGDSRQVGHTAWLLVTIVPSIKG